MKNLSTYITESQDGDVVYNSLLESELFLKTLKDVFEQKGLRTISTLDELLKYLRRSSKYVAAHKEDFFIDGFKSNSMLIPAKGKTQFDIIEKVMGYLLDHI